MRRLSFLIFLIFFGRFISGQSPHTDALKVDCAQCHNPADWKVDPKTSKI